MIINQKINKKQLQLNKNQFKIMNFHKTPKYIRAAGGATRSDEKFNKNQVKIMNFHKHQKEEGGV